jgi:two-component system sensor histidine kinase/response regulator
MALLLGVPCGFSQPRSPEWRYGFQATAAIREKEKTSGGRVPIVALTANAMRGDGERCLAQGMDAYLAKPFRIADLDRVSGEVTGAAARPV